MLHLLCFLKQMDKRIINYKRITDVCYCQNKTVFNQKDKNILPPSTL